jgi:hypothetical protein
VPLLCCWQGEFEIASASYTPYSLPLASPLTTGLGSSECPRREGLLLRVALGAAETERRPAVGVGEVAPLPGGFSLQGLGHRIPPPTCVRSRLMWDPHHILRQVSCFCMPSWTNCILLVSLMWDSHHILCQVSCFCMPSWSNCILLV